MSFIVRSIRETDFEDVFSLAKQFTLLNLPADAKVLKQKIDISLKSFAGKLSKEDAEYLFVLEDTEVGRVIGTCLILAKHGSESSPHYYFKVLEKKHHSQALGIGFIHNVLRLGENTDGPTEIGGLLLDRGYRRRPEKLGRFLSLSRFVFMGMYPEHFQPEILCELSPPLTDEGRSEFWEALGRRFTGMSYKEADRLSQLHKGFIKTLFPEEDIYLCLLDSEARIVVGDVADATRPAKHMLEKIGFQYKKEVDPFDGGPHYSAKLNDISLIKEGRKLVVKEGQDGLEKLVLMGFVENGEFCCVQTRVAFKEDRVLINSRDEETLKAFIGKEVFCSQL